MSKAFSHTPIRPVRNMTEEKVYARRWEELMNTPLPDEWSVGKIFEVLRTYPYVIDQNAVSLAASMIVWLGTSVGREFLLLGEKIKNAVPDLKYTAYAAAWGAVNARVAHRENRLIQYLTRTSKEQDEDRFTLPTREEMEVLDQVATWLGTDEGQKFINQAEAEINRRNDLDTIAFKCAAGRQFEESTQKLIDKLVIRD